MREPLTPPAPDGADFARAKPVVAALEASAHAPTWQRLKRNFVLGLAQREQALMAAANTDPIPSDQLMLHLHRLAGAAGTFGFVELEQCSRCTMVELEQPLVPGPALRARLAQLKSAMALARASVAN